MFKLKNNQKTIFDHFIYLADHMVQALEKPWAGPFHCHMLPLIKKELFRPFYCPDNRLDIYTEELDFALQ